MQRHFNLKKKPVTLINELPKQWQSIQDTLASSGVLKEIAEGVTTTTDQLIKPEQSYDPLANEMIHTNRKKKKRLK